MVDKKDKNSEDFKIDLEKSWEDIGDALDEAKVKLQEITDDIMGVAKDVKKEFDDEENENVDNKMKNYEKEMGKAIATIVHENSPYLDEMFKGEDWKKVLKPNAPMPFIDKLKKEDKKDEK